MKNPFKLKPFDRVLVRDSSNHSWRIDIYSRSYIKGGVTWNECIGNSWKQCIPYNEETAHLLGTTKAYNEPQQKEYHIWTSGSFDEWMTEDEFQNFITTAVIHNKDITDFHVLRIRS